MQQHIADLFDFEKDVIKPFGTIYLPWQTGTSVKTTRLIFNLWSGVSIDLDYVLRALKHNASDIGNIRAYLITTLFNSHTTVSNYYSTMAYSDIREGRI